MSKVQRFTIQKEILFKRAQRPLWNGCFTAHIQIQHLNEVSSARFRKVLEFFCFIFRHDLEEPKNIFVYAFALMCIIVSIFS